MGSAGRVVRGLVLWGKSDLPDQAPPNTVEEQDPNDHTVLRALEYLLASRILNPHERERLPTPELIRQAEEGHRQVPTQAEGRAVQVRRCDGNKATGTG